MTLFAAHLTQSMEPSLQDGEDEDEGEEMDEDGDAGMEVEEEEDSDDSDDEPVCALFLHALLYKPSAVRFVCKAQRTVVISRCVPAVSIAVVQNMLLTVLRCVSV